MRSIFQICKDFLHLFVSTAGFCVAITFNCVASFGHFLHYVFYQQTKFLFQTFMWLPICIVISIILQLVFLPINIPLKILAGTSMKNIIGNTYVKTNTYVITTLLQYSLVLLVFGVMIGLLCGVGLSVIHFLIVIPDLSFNISLSALKKRLPHLNIGKPAFISNITRIFQAEIPRDENLDIPTPSPSILPSGHDLEELLAKSTITPYRSSHKKSWHRRSSSSKESVLEVASKLPSDFFQKRGSISEERQQIYQTPVQSPSNKTLDDSSYASSNMWDQFDELPSTLRTEGGVSTLYSRRPLGVSNKNEQAYVSKLKNRI